MAELRTFVLVYEGKVISPLLVTVREYANWLESVFDSSICHQHLYLSARKSDGTFVFEWHPGTRLGTFFDNQPFYKPELQSWFIRSDGKAMSQLIQHKFAESRDSSLYHKEQRLRVYTVEQIEVYIKTAIDNTFSLTDKILSPKQITLSKSDMDTLVRPVQSKKKRLF